MSWRPSASLFAARQLHGQRADHGLGHPVLKCENIRIHAIVAFGPLLGTGCAVDQLHIDPHLAVGPPDTAFEHIADTQFTRHQTRIGGLAPVGK